MLKRHAIATVDRLRVLLAEAEAETKQKQEALEAVRKLRSDDEAGALLLHSVACDLACALCACLDYPDNGIGCKTEEEAEEVLTRARAMGLLP